MRLRDLPDAVDRGEMTAPDVVEFLRRWRDATGPARAALARALNAGHSDLRPAVRDVVRAHATADGCTAADAIADLQADDLFTSATTRAWGMDLGA